MPSNGKFRHSTTIFGKAFFVSSFAQTSCLLQLLAGSLRSEKGSVRLRYSPEAQAKPAEPTRSQTFLLPDFCFFLTFVFSIVIRRKMAKDLFHDIVKIALEKEGWTITHDPYELKLDDLDLFTSKLKIDLGAEKMLAAEKGTEKIAVEIKTLSGPSLIYEVHALLGQYLNYQLGIDIQEPDRVLYAAIPEKAYHILAPQGFIQMMIAKYKVHLIVYDQTLQIITHWVT